MHNGLTISDAAMKSMQQPSASNSLSVGARGFDLIGFDMPQRTGRNADESGHAMFRQQAADAGLHPYVSDMGARLFERMMDEFEDRF